MSTEYSLSLRLARRNRGLTQQDCGYLLGVHNSRLSDIECGRSVPTLEQACLLSIIYGHPFEELFAKHMATARSILKKRIHQLQPHTKLQSHTISRHHTIAHIKQQLDLNHPRHEPL